MGKIFTNEKWSKRKIIRKIKQLKKSGVILSPSIMKKKYPKLFAAAINNKYFGSWRNALQKIGIDADKEYKKYNENNENFKWSKQKIIEKIKKIKIENLKSVYKTNKALYSAAYRIFGSWDKALKKSKRFKKYKNYEKEQLLKDIRNYYIKNGKEDITKKNRSLYDRVYKKYGSWDNGLKKAGIKIKKED